MATITSLTVIQEIIENEGRCAGDPDVAMVVEYDNAFGGTAWGVTWVTESVERQRRYLVETDYVRNPRLLWRKP